MSKRLLSKIKLMNNLEDAIDYIVRTRFILDYAFLGSKISLTYLSQNNFIQKYVPLYILSDKIILKFTARNYIILLTLGTKTRKYSFMLLQSVMFHLILV